MDATTEQTDAVSTDAPEAQEPIAPETPTERSAPVTNVAWMAGGQALASSSNDGTVLMQTRPVTVTGGGCGM